MTDTLATQRAEALLPNASLKRIAWAFGCAKKGSDEEARLRDALLLRVRGLLVLDESAPPEDA